MNSSKQVPVLITWDVDPDSWVSNDTRINGLNTVRTICESNGIPATFYVTADGADSIAQSILELQDGGHEIGCHGLTHGMEEDYNRMPVDLQELYISQATHRLEKIIQLPVRSFRSPRVKTSAATLRILGENGYWSDSSVCSQRSDLVSSNLINLGWLVAPRKPYHPHIDSPFRRGNLDIWEIPVSAAILPFITSTMKVLGLPTMKVLFRMLYAESKLTGKPIVFLGHPIELVRIKKSKRSRKKQFTKYTNLKYLSPGYIRTYGLQLRSMFYKYDGDTFSDLISNLFSWMKTYPDIRFMTVQEYTEVHL